MCVGTSKPLGNTSQILLPDGTKRAQYTDSKSPVHRSAYSGFHTKAEFCGACHNVDHPLNGMHLEATYTEWKNGPYAAEGIVCQDCHMTPGPGVMQPNPGKAAAMGPQREHVYTMTWVGGNSALGPKDLVEERLRAAARIDLETPGVVEPGDRVTVGCTVTNIGAGHYLPTGLTEVRQMWLEVTAKDASGKELLRERRDFGTVLKDARGAFPVELWDAVAVQKDDRIPPRESVSDSYRFSMSEDGPVEVSAALYYRSASERLARKAGVDVPTTLMARVSGNVFGSRKAAADFERSGAKGGGGGTVLPLWIALSGLAGLGAVVVVGALKTRKA
jgi:hypothetical protein